MVELGIPFSDPIADGPVIAASMHEALQAGVTPRDVFDTVRRLRPDTGHALVAMVRLSGVLNLNKTATPTTSTSIRRCMRLG